VSCIYCKVLVSGLPCGATTENRPNVVPTGARSKKHLRVGVTPHGPMTNERRRTARAHPHKFEGVATRRRLNVGSKNLPVGACPNLVGGAPRQGLNARRCKDHCLGAHPTSGDGAPRERLNRRRSKDRSAGACPLIIDTGRQPISGRPAGDHQSMTGENCSKYRHIGSSVKANSATETAKALRARIGLRLPSPGRGRSVVRKHYHTLPRIHRDIQPTQTPCWLRWISSVVGESRR
jgi:hypothetical protein